MLKFCAWFAKTRGVNITQVFPVREHSFSQCDRNFGMVRKQIKNTEVIGTAKPYMNAMVLCRKDPCPFEVIMDRDILKEWDEALSPMFLPKSSSKLNKFTIMKYVTIKIKQDGSLLCSENFNTVNFKPFKFLNGPTYDIQPQVMPYPEVSSDKIKDVRSLYRFLNNEDKDWIENLFK